MFRCLLVKETENSVYNIGGEDYSLKEVAERIATVRQTTIRFQEWPPVDLMLESGDTVFDSRKLDVVLRYRYQHRFLDWLNSL